MKKQQTHKILFFCSAFILLSCSFSYCSKPFTILQTTYHNWTGGVKGVKGKVYNIDVKVSKPNTIEFMYLKKGSERTQLNTTKNGLNYYLKAIVNESIPEKTVSIDGSYDKAAPDKADSDIFLEYKILKTGKLKSVKLDGWKYKSNDPNEALIQ